MGRKAGVSAEQTRAELLEAAARVFALKGYDGASIANITAEAGLSSGAIYAHYRSKAELFVAVVKAHAHSRFTSLVGGSGTWDDPDWVPEIAGSVTDVVAAVGASYVGADELDDSLMIEAIVAAKRHPEIAELVTTWLGDGEAVMATALATAQDGGLVDPGLSAAAISRFMTMVALGARLSGAMRLPDVDADEWAQLITRLVAATGPRADPADGA